MKRIAALLFTALFLMSAAASMFTETATASAMRLEAVTGTVTVRNASGVEQTVRDGMRLYNGYAIATGASSEAYVSLDSSKAVKLGSSGQIQIQRSGKRLEVSVISGELFFNVTAPLKDDESLNVRTSTMVTGIRGSFGWVRSGETGLMHGLATLTARNPRTGKLVTATLRSGEMARYDANPDSETIKILRRPIETVDVPALVVREMRARPELLEEVRRDVPALGAVEALSGLNERVEAEQETQAALDQRYAVETLGAAPSGGANSETETQLLKRFWITVLVPERYQEKYGEKLHVFFMGPDENNVLLVPNGVYLATRHWAWESQIRNFKTITEMELEDGATVSPTPEELNTVGACYDLNQGGLTVTKDGKSQIYTFRYLEEPTPDSSDKPSETAEDGQEIPDEPEGNFP